ncbi:MAG: ShlB/FhaC/HecB family hemolysin secretion/activation protein, partial [Thauera sp.]
EVEEAVYPFLGPDRSAEDIERARAALEAVYAKKGYATVATEVPRQDVTTQVVTLRVVERPVGRLRVRGANYFLPSTVKAGVPSVAEGEVPNFNTLQEELIDLSLVPDRRVTPVLRAGVAPGTVDVEMQVEDKLPLHGSFELNNRKSANTEPLRAITSLRYDNLWQRGDSISFSYQVAPQRTADTEVFSGSYVARIPETRLSALLYGLKSESDVATVGGVGVIGNGEIIGGRILWPVTLEPGFVQSLSAGIDYKHFGEDTIFGTNVTQAPITYYPVTLGWAGNWSTETAKTDAGANVVFTFGGLGSSNDDFENKRYNADSSFILLQADASRTQTLPEDFQLFGRVQSQASGQQLINNEQFSIGGLDSVRGYLESEALGDYGASVQAEARTPSFDDLLGAWAEELRLRNFFDFGTAGIHRPLPDQDGSYVLYSAGVGATIKLLDHFNGTLDVAVPLTDGPDTEKGHLRTSFRAWGEF